jgi:hypothetical protein
MSVGEDLIEVRLVGEDDFLKIKETLMRIGIASRKEKKLFQSCHILHKRGRYYIVHFKELFLLDGKPSNFTEDDVARRNAIINLLTEWGLVQQIDPRKTREPVAPISQIKILPYKDKDDWELIAKYKIGKKINSNPPGGNNF